MPRGDNLKGKRENTQFRSGVEAVYSGKKGGISSGKARREKACFLSSFQKLSTAPVVNAKFRKQLEECGLDPDECSMADFWLCTAILNGAQNEGTGFVARIMALNGETTPDNGGGKNTEDDPLTASLRELAKELESDD